MQHNKASLVTETRLKELAKKLTESIGGGWTVEVDDKVRHSGEETKFVVTMSKGGARVVQFNDWKRKCRAIDLEPEDFEAIVNLGAGRRVQLVEIKLQNRKYPIIARNLDKGGLYKYGARFFDGHTKVRVSTDDLARLEEKLEQRSQQNSQKSSRSSIIKESASDDDYAQW